MNNEDIFLQEFPQNCGDILKIVEKIYGEKYQCQFLKYPCEVLATLSHIKRGCVNNPQIEKVEFIDKIWHQNCGDDLKILKKLDSKVNWEVEFIKYPKKVVAKKINIIRGKVGNPLINIYKYYNRIYSQHCGDDLIIKEGIYDKEQQRILYKGIFKKYPYEVIVRADQFLKGVVNNPLIEENEFVGKVYPQNCGDLLKVIRKTNQKAQKCHNYYYECQFLSNNYKVLAFKNNILIGNVLNHLNKELNSIQETELKNFISVTTNKHIEFNCWDILKDKEIDIYIPELKLGFEYNGIYWHSKEFKDKNYHLDKTLEANKLGIRLIHIWEDEWVFEKEKLKNWIKNLLLGIPDNLFLGDICKEGIVKDKHTEPKLIKRDRFYCYNCGYNE